MKKKSIFWGAAFICAAILIIADAVSTGLGFLDRIPVVKIILGVLCLCWFISELYQKRLPHIFFPLSFLFMLFEKEIAKLCGIESGNLISNWLVLLCALLLTIGTAMIVPRSHPGGSRKITGRSTQYIDSSTFTYREVDNNMGSVVVLFENAESYPGGGTLKVDNNMGAIEIRIPADWHVITNIENNMGSIKLPSAGNPGGKEINLIGENHMGSIGIELV